MGGRVRVVVLLIDRCDVGPAGLLHAIVRPFESFGDEYMLAEHSSQHGAIELTFSKENLLADFADHDRGLR